jgi:hypothetical protein
VTDVQVEIAWLKAISVNNVIAGTKTMSRTTVLVESSVILDGS